jgi:hypothetical protein
MQLISSHIAYLLTKHECVIVPALGAFVVSSPERPKNKKTGLLCPPSKFLGFNPDLRHNDGLLANAIAQSERIAYKDACLQITRYVDSISAQLQQHIPLQLPWIGKLEQSPDHKWLFTPAHQLSCNAHTFGMDNFYLPTIRELNYEDRQPSPTPIRPQQQKPSLLRRSLSIAAAILALLMVAIPISDHSSQYSQTANLLPKPPSALHQPKPAPPAEETPAILTPYYIIVASLPTKASAQLQIERFQANGLSNLSIISANNKHRIYVASFSNKAEANTFLSHFRNEHPQHNNAWLLFQRN